MSLIKKLLKIYDNETMEIQKKAKSILIGGIINVVLIILAICSFFLLENKIEMIISQLIMVISIIVIIVSIVLLLKRRINHASAFYGNAIPFVLFIIFFFANYNYDGIGRYAGGILCGLCLLFLISTKRNQIIIYIVESVILMVVFSVLTKYYRGLEYNSDFIRYLFQSIIIFLLGGVCVVVVNGIIEERLKLTAAESKRNRERFEKINSLLMSSNDTIDIGERLNDSTAKTLLKIKDIDKDLYNINNESIELNSQYKENIEFNNKMFESSKIVKNSFEDYNSTVSEVSALIEEMTSSIDNVSNISKSKKDFIDNLVKTANEAEEEMNDAISFVEDISRKASNIFEIIDVIQNVASQTDLLAMNAAIEAAHAGEAGKGFAVVADEIRKLAEQTNNNLKIITTSLKKNFEDIQFTAENNKKINNYFKKLSSEIGVVEQSMEEIISAMLEMSEGTSETIKGVMNMTSMSQTISASINNIENMIEKSNILMKSFSEKISNITIKTDAITKNFSEIVTESKEIRNIGQKNKDYIIMLKHEIEKIND